MKTTQTTPKVSAVTTNGVHLGRKQRFDHSSTPLFPETNTQSRIQWPTEKQILEVSKKLAQISRMGIRAEAKGDYFNSGDLAYQMQEIIKATSGLFERGRRLGRKSQEE